MNTKMEEKHGSYKAKGILDYRREKTYTATTNENKREEARLGQRESENTNRIDIGTGARIKSRLQLAETPDSESLF